MLPSIPHRSHAMRAIRHPASKNKLLAAFPSAVLRSLEHHLQRVVLALGEAVDEPRERLRYAIFPEDCVISVICLTPEGKTIEVANIGREGMTGLPAVAGVDQLPHRYVVQISGNALRIETRELAEIAGYDSGLAGVLLRYYSGFASQVMQNVACSGLHSLEQRCCRWLLSTHDRVESDQFPLTHEVLAMLLGTRRSSVSDVLKNLRDRHLIEYHRGLITIVDRATLEQRACECYEVVARMHAGKSRK
jgi:CRP-like cAMP-binding protein